MCREADRVEYASRVQHTAERPGKDRRQQLIGGESAYTERGGNQERDPHRESSHKY